MNTVIDNRALPAYDSESLYPNSKRLSSSQFLCYEQSPQDFYIQYEIGAKGKGSSAMSVGRIFSAAYANRDLDYRWLLEQAKAPKRYADLFKKVLEAMPPIKGGSPELALITKFNGWELRATLDDYVKDGFTIIENKTGKMAWTQERVNFADQLTFQAWVHWKQFKIIPRRIYLNYIDLNANATKLIQTFATTRSVTALKQFERRVEAVIENIGAGNFTKPIYS